MKEITRRDFAKNAIALSVGTALSRMRILGANDRINIGLIGCGDRGTSIFTTFLKQPDVTPIAVCDVYSPFMSKAAALGTNIATHGDFRRILDLKNVDAVVIGTPDHWHALPTILACQAGKDVYVEKPLTLTVVEGRHMIEAARKHNRIVQTGSQQRSGPHYQAAVKLIHEGAIGSIYKISAGYTRNVIPGFKPTEFGNNQPKELDWDMWLGPAPKVPFDPFRCIYNFRWFWDYSGGQMTNWGAHNLDIARWAIQARGPSSVSGYGGRHELKDGGETPDVQEVLYNFGNTIISWSGREVNRTRDEYLVFHGTKGTLNIMRDGFTVTPEVWKPTRSKDTPAMQPIEMKGDARAMDGLHIRNFLDCVKDRKRPIGDVEEGHLSAVVCHLGNIATRLGRSLKWDVAKEQFVGDAEGNRMLSKPYRAPWKLA